MPIIFLHIPKTGGTSVDKLISQCVSDNELRSITLHAGNVPELQKKPTSYFKAFDYIHIHACNIQACDALREVINNQACNCFTLFRFPTNYFESFWRHSMQIAPQALPTRPSIPSLHERFNDINSCIKDISTHGTIDFTNNFFKQYNGLTRMFWGQLVELKNLMGRPHAPTGNDLKWFALEDPNLNYNLRHYLESGLKCNMEVNLSHSNKTTQCCKSKLNLESIKRLAPIYKKDMLRYLKICKGL